IPAYIIRAIGGTLYLIGAIMAVYNLAKTMKKGQFVNNELAEGIALKNQALPQGGHWHSKLERKPVLLLVLSLIAVGIGGLVELTPTLLVDKDVPVINAVKPYTPLELHGRDIYVREGCYTCHSQM